MANNNHLIKKLQTNTRQHADQSKELWSQYENQTHHCSKWKWAFVEPKTSNEIRPHAGAIKSQLDTQIAENNSTMANKRHQKSQWTLLH